MIFISISAWYLLDRPQTLSRCLARVWEMERELLFYSWGMLVLFFLFDRRDLTLEGVAMSVLPAVMQCWWYATAYILFLLVLPALRRGLKALGRDMHLRLAAVLLAAFGLTGLLPRSFGPQRDVFGFIYYVVLLSAYKWHCRPLRSRTLAMGIVIGYLLYALNWFAIFLVASIAGKSHGYMYLTGEWKLPVMMIGASIFLLAERRAFYSPVVNRLASASFAVYLISEYAAMRTLLWTRVFRLDAMMGVPFRWLAVAAMVVGIYLVFAVVDFGRQALFARVNARRGIALPLAEKAYHRLVSRLAK